ncbi:3-deoxy-D-manno-octulosonic acid transferase [Litorisediminicola beolgyonensis]|uniref:3-deoxy-D-manno-octulosonic acid transferase n=1 Tax=Litorisediminicola beolgyonensis TaxID=1173614 RepID=A0ABW3ZHK7_9RHOB
MPRRAFSLRAYLALARARGAAGPGPDAPERPKGALLWLHACSRADTAPLETLAQRMIQQRPDLSLLRTGAWEQPDLTLPADTPSDAARFHATWRPDLGVWSGYDLSPALIAAATGPMILVNAGEEPFSTPAARWMPDAAPATLQLFSQIYATSAEASRALRRSGVESARIRAAGPLTDIPPALDCSDTAHEETAQILAARPLWLAARLRAPEARAVIDAHLRAARLAHRLLLVIVPQTVEDAAEAEAVARDSGARLCLWDADEMPDENTQILLCGDASELGLWYRLAPLSFLGGSLMPGEGGTNPFEAAALGSAILYGPNVGRHLTAYTRLVDAGAARIVRDTDSLGGAVAQLVAPDRAAAMAMAGWEIVSQGAEVTDAIIDAAFELIDAPPAPEVA